MEAISAYMRSPPEYIFAVQTVPQLTNINLFVMRVSVYVRGDGWLMLPVLSCITQILLTKRTQNKSM